MKRNLVIVLAAVVLAVAVWWLRRGPQATGEAPARVAGQYLNDSLGVGMLLPSTPGWSFRYAPDVPGGGLAMAIHAGQTASVRLYEHARTDVSGLEEVIRDRRKQLAEVFQVTEVDSVIESVIKEEFVDFDGHPAWQWQAVTEPVAVAGKEPQRVMFMLLILERPEHVFEAVGILGYPARPTPEQQAALQALANDITFILGSFQVR